MQSSSDNGSPAESEGVQPDLLPILSLWTRFLVHKLDLSLNFKHRTLV